MIPAAYHEGKTGGLSKGNAHFDDCLQYFVAKKLGAEATVSFDRHFDLDVPRHESKDTMFRIHQNGA